MVESEVANQGRRWAEIEAQNFAIDGVDIEDRVGICLEALVAAMRTWQPGRGANLQSYAVTLMRRRLIDRARKFSLQVRTIPYRSEDVGEIQPDTEAVELSSVARGVWQELTAVYDRWVTAPEPPPSFFLEAMDQYAAEVSNLDASPKNLRRLEAVQRFVDYHSPQANLFLADMPVNFSAVLSVAEALASVQIDVAIMLASGMSEGQISEATGYSDELVSWLDESLRLVSGHDSEFRNCLA